MCLVLDQYSTMSPKTCLIVLFHVFTAALAKVLPEVLGSLGNSVTLRSGADPSWNLTKIEWSIFPNNTWIATYRTGKIHTERFSQYKGRLSLNDSTGDLTIRDLTQEDDMEYTVDLTSTTKNNAVNKVKLKVMKQVEAPSIKTLFSAHKDGGYWVALKCSTEDEDVELSWAKPPTAVTYNMSNTAETNSLLLAFLKTHEKHAKFTCTSSRAMGKAPKDVTVKFPDEPWNPGFLWFLFGFIVGFAIPLTYINRDKLKDAWEWMRARVLKLSGSGAGAQ